MQVFRHHFVIKPILMNTDFDEYLPHWNVPQNHVFEGVLWSSCSEKFHKTPVKITT